MNTKSCMIAARILALSLEQLKRKLEFVLMRIQRVAESKSEIYAATDKWQIVSNEAWK